MQIVTHDGEFHADDVYATAALTLLYPEANITRSRDFQTIRQGDVALDVGGEYDVSRKRFDHHQPEGAGMRENGVPYASFGLIWKHYGPLIVNSEEVWAYVDQQLVQFIDAHDVGHPVYSVLREDVSPVTIPLMIGSFNPTWQEHGT